MTLLTLLKATTGGGGVAVGYRASSKSGTTDVLQSNIAVPVPAGAAAGDIALLAVKMWNAGNPAVTWPAGFTETVSATTGSNLKLKIAWKRLTGADSGSYTPTWTGTQWTMGMCILITGGIATGDPIEATNTATGSGTSIPSTTLTTATLPFLAHFVHNDDGSASGTPPTSYTEVQDADYMKTNYRIPGSTGSHTASGGTVSASVSLIAALLAVMPDAGGGGVTGTIAVTQDANTSAAAGKLGYSGTAAPSQAANTASASGTVSGPVTGTIAVTQAAQTAAATGKLGYSGTIAATQANQTASATGQLRYTGTATPAQAGNTASASGTFTPPGAVTGTIAVTQANQTAAAVGQLRYSGTAAATQANQTSTATGKLGYSGTVATTQAANTAAASGVVTGPVVGTVAAVQANQTATATGILRYTGTLAVSQAANIATIQGIVFIPITGAVAATQANQTANASGSALGDIVIRPDLGTTVRPVSGTTTRPALGLTLRLVGGITPRPFTTTTPRP